MIIYIYYKNRCTYEELHITETVFASHAIKIVKEGLNAFVIDGMKPSKAYRIDQGSFVGILEAIAPLNPVETEEYLFDAYNHGRIKLL